MYTKFIENWKLPAKLSPLILCRKLFYGVDEDNKTLLQVFKEHNEQSRKLIGKDFVSKTVQRYETTTRYLEEFIKKEYQLSDIALNNLEANFISKFDAFLKIEKGCAQNSAITRLQSLKKIIRITLENNWIKKDPFAYYRFKLEETDPEWVNWVWCIAGNVKAFIKIREQHPEKTIPVCYYLYSLEGALLNLHWNDIPSELKKELKDKIQD